MAWLEGWAYRKEITLSRAAGAVSNYQMKLLVGESSGAIGEDVDCNSHVLSSFDDLRFTTSDEETLLSCWIESITGATPNCLATVWIEFDSIGTDATTFYMYYGKADATAVSSGADTFLFFDDFPGSSLDADKWDLEDTPTVTVSGGTVTVSAGANTWRGIKTDSTFGEVDIAWRSKADIGDADYQICGMKVDTNPNNANNGGFFYFYGGTAYKNYYVRSTGATASDLAGGDANEHIYEITSVSGQVYYYRDGAQVGSMAYTFDASVPMRCMAGGYGANSQVIMDWVLVRQFKATEPAWGSWGNEESGTTAWTQELSDGFTLSDASSNFTGLATGDSLSLAEAISKFAGVALPDSFTLIDAETRRVAFSLGDTLYLVDATVRQIGFLLSLSDAFSLGDSLSKRGAVSLADIISLGDALAKSFGANKGDVFLLQDGQSKYLARTLSDVITLVEQLLGNGGNINDFRFQSIALQDVIITDGNTFYFKPGIN